MTLTSIFATLGAVRAGFLVLIACSFWGLANATVQVAVDELPLGALVEYIKDPEGHWTLADIQQMDPSRFKPLPDANLGYSAATLWLRVSLARAPHAHPDRLLAIAHFELNEVVFYAPEKAAMRAGLDYPINPDLWPDRFFVFPLQLTETPQTYYLKVRSDSAVILPLTLWAPRAFAAQTEKINFAHALYYGGLLTLIIYNLLIYSILRQKSFLLYGIFASLMLLGMMGLNGVLRHHFWPAAWPWPLELQLSLTGFTMAFALYFTQAFLNTASALPPLHRMIHAAAALCLLTALGPWLLLPAFVLSVLASLLLLITASLVISAGIVSWRAGNSSARLFLLAWGVLSLGSITAALHSLGLLPSTLLTSHALQISSSIEMLLLSFALAERMRLEQNAREAAQADALLARQALLDSVQESGLLLEKTVRERTAELNYALQNERSLLNRYIRFGALIAHEFRNPLAIIKAQLSLISYEQTRGTDHLERRLASITAATRRLGVLFDEWLQSDRLRNPDLLPALSPIPVEGWLQDLVEECRDCYTAHRFELTLLGHLPDLWVDEALLRGAIYNLIDNAAKHSPAGTMIHLETKYEDGMIGILVMDHGPGVPEKYQKTIFLDYFRIQKNEQASKQTQGLGLGLAFVKKIVELHQGWIELKTKSGAGAGFCLWLPVTPESDEKDE